jgi:acyl-CoA dehydrogenase
MKEINLETVKLSDNQKLMVESMKNLVDSLSKEYDREKVISMGNQFFRDKEMPPEVFTILENVTSSGLLKTLGLDGVIEGFLGGKPTLQKGGIPIKVDDMRALVIEFVKIYSKEINEVIDKGIADLNSTFKGVTLAVTALAVNGILGYGSGKLIAKYIPGLLSGNLLGFAVTEPNAGTNTFKITTTAVKEGEYYRVNGQKVFISGGEDASAFYTAVRLIEDGKDMGIYNIVVDKGNGVEVTPMDIEVFPGEKQCYVFFDNVMVPKENLVGGKKDIDKKEKARSESFFFSLNFERLLVGILGLALGNIILNKAIEYAKQKKILDKEAGKYQVIKHALARLKIQLELANIAAHEGAVFYDNRENPELVGLYANTVKLMGSELSNDACDLAIQIYGSDGLTLDSELWTLLQMARVIRILPINNEMCLNFIGEHSLGLPKSYR